jgi:hypothetical protein
MANVVDEEARKTPGKRQLAMEAYARALRQLPTIIADNAGYDSAELISKVRAAHAGGDIRAGIDVRTGTVGNMQELGITEALKLKRQVLLSASEAAEMILRVDDIIKCAPRRRDQDDREWRGGVGWVGADESESRWLASSSLTAPSLHDAVLPRRCRRARPLSGSRAAVTSVASQRAFRDRS